jgi:mono/diheme cytochrome c family protein
MKIKTVSMLALVLALWLAVAPARAGGWAVVSLEEWPEEIRAGEAAAIVFSIRQHGAALAPGYDPIIRANRAGTSSGFQVTAIETKQAGFYTADLTFPEPGNWKWSISYYGDAASAQTMPELAVSAPELAAGSARADGIETSQGLSLGYVVSALGTLTLFGGAGFFAVTRSRSGVAAAIAGVVVIAAGLLIVPRAQAAESSTAPADAARVDTVSLADQGQFLFQAKGCIVCHNHEELREGYTGITTDIGPDLTWGTKRPLEFLQSWLKDPVAIKPGTSMPNLELSEAEIEALAAFVMGELDN